MTDLLRIDLDGATELAGILRIWDSDVEDIRSSLLQAETLSDIATNAHLPLLEIGDNGNAMANALDSAVATAVSFRISDWLGDDWRGVTEGDLDNVHDALEELTDPQLDEVLGDLTDDEIETLFHNVHSSGRLSNDWNDRERREFYEVLDRASPEVITHILLTVDGDQVDDVLGGIDLTRFGSVVDIDDWTAIGERTELIDPDPTKTGIDNADPDAEAGDRIAELEYLDFSHLPLYTTDASGNPVLDPGALRQGGIGDCYFIAAAITIARQDPSLITDMIQPNPNGTYTVTFGDGSQEVVSARFIVDKDTTNPFGAYVGTDGSTSEALSIMLLEKAYAQREGGYGQDPGITQGSTHVAVEDLIGVPGNYVSSGNFTIEDMGAVFDNGGYLGLSTIDRPDYPQWLGWIGIDEAEWKKDVWPNLPSTPEAFGTDFGSDRYQRMQQNHAFIVTDVDVEAGTVSVLNPWDASQPPFDLTFEQLEESVNGIYVNNPT